MKGQDIMIYVGIDVASQKHDCFLLKDTGEVFRLPSLSKMILKDIKNSTIQFYNLWSQLKIQMYV